jgi:hypothetical protein
MEITTTTINRNPDRRAAVNALAIVGFIALLIIGIGLAIYSARFVPNIASRFGGAAVSLSSIFKKSEDPALEVVTATTTLPFEGVTGSCNFYGSYDHSGKAHRWNRKCWRPVNNGHDRRYYSCNTLR